MPSRFYGRRKSYKSGYKKTGKKVYSSKRATYYKKKRAGPSFKKYANYGKRTARKFGYPQVKKSIMYRPISLRDVTIFKYSKDVNGRWLNTSPVTNQGAVHVLPLTGEPQMLHNAFAKAAQENYSAPSSPEKATFVSQSRKITFVIGPQDLITPGQLEGGMEMDIYFFQARVDIGSSTFALSGYEGMFNYLYDAEQYDALASDLTHPNFTPFMSSEWCKRWKMYKHEKVILDEKKRTHTILDINRRPIKYSENSYSDGTTNNAMKGVTRVAVICTRGVLGLCNGVEPPGTTLGYAMYTPLPQSGWLSHYESSLSLTDASTNPSYYIDATVQPVGSDAVVIDQLSNTVTAVN